MEDLKVFLTKVEGNHLAYTNGKTALTHFEIVLIAEVFLKTDMYLYYLTSFQQLLLKGLSGKGLNHFERSATARLLLQDMERNA